ncbi:MAG: ABC transporter ATP-binding protein [Lachnospiraceae bacterium]|nr:ABC transporter ATP-binding protein [Lachnospiraceae bacterium]
MLKKEKRRIFINIGKTLKWSLTELKEYRGKVCLYVVFLIIHALYGIFMTTKVGNVVDLALMDNTTQLVRAGIVLIALFIGNTALSITANRVSARTFNSMFNSLEMKVYRKIMDSSWEELTEYHSGDLITRLTSDIKTVAQNTSSLVPTMIAKITLIICAGLYIVYLDYSMVLVAVLIGPVMLIASRLFMGKVYDSHREIREIESRITSFNKETFNNIQAIKAFNLGNLFYDKMDGFESHRKAVDLQSNKYSLLSWGTTYLTGIIGAIACVGWMFYRVHSGVISFGALSVLAFLALQVGDALKALLNMIPTIMEYVASAERVKKLIFLHDEEEEIEDSKISAFAMEAKEHGVSVRIKDMFFRYRNGYSVFEGASLYANPGEIIALVGPSGEGKTTMLRIILGIVTALQGDVSASGESGQVPLGKQTRQLISYVPQGNTMMAGSILENMRLIKADVSEEELEEVLETTCILDFVKKLPEGLAHELGENGLGFSEGQNQRLSIARALLKDAPVLLMDEATSALDVSTERRILNNIMKKNPKKTVILTTHRPSVLSMCDRIYRIADKKVTVIGQEEVQKLIDEF